MSVNLLDVRQSIVELAETVKETVRLQQCISLHIKEVSPNLALPPHLVKRLDDVYRKASRAKDRMDV